MNVVTGLLSLFFLEFTFFKKRLKLVTSFYICFCGGFNPDFLTQMLDFLKTTLTDFDN